jgi:hypothetical protein
MCRDGFSADEGAVRGELEGGAGGGAGFISGVSPRIGGLRRGQSQITDIDGDFGIGIGSTWQDLCDTRRQERFTT